MTSGGRPSRTFLGLCFALLASCSPSSGERPVVSKPKPEAHAGARIAREFRRESKISFLECVDAACFRKAAESCTPVHLGNWYRTVEGSRVETDTFLVKDGSGCWIEKVSDFSADYWGGCMLWEQRCKAAPPTGNEVWGGEDCTRVLVRRLRPCKYPYE